MSNSRGTRHKQQDAFSQKPVFEIGLAVARIVRACGENIYEVEDGTGAKVLYQLPKRLRHVVFVRRGNFVFVREDNTRGPGKVRGDIEVVVMDCFLKELRAEKFWPASFAKDVAIPSTHNNVAEEPESGEDDDDDSWEIGAGNPNRRPPQYVESDSSEDE